MPIHFAGTRQWRDSSPRHPSIASPGEVGDDAANQKQQEDDRSASLDLTRRQTRVVAGPTYADRAEETPVLILRSLGQGWPRKTQVEGRVDVGVSEFGIVMIIFSETAHTF